MNAKDLVGKRFNKLVVKEYIGKSKNYKPLYNCICDCGKEKIVDIYALKSSSVKSCGCVKKESNRKIDMIGKRFGKLIVIKESDYRGKNEKEIYYTCECDCGETKDILGTSLRRKRNAVKSCGCGLIDSVKTHGLVGTKIYKTWDSMKQRCYNTNDTNYKNYGGRGIRICDEWLGDEGLANFYNWSIRNGYNDKLSIDRIDNDKGYSPDNCRWVSMKIQQNNKRDNIYITFNNETKTLSNWADEIGVNYITLQKRIKGGWSIERALTEDVKPYELNKQICIDGECCTYKEWSKITGIKINTLRGRYANGLRGKDLIKPVDERMSVR